MNADGARIYIGVENSCSRSALHDRGASSQTQAGRIVGVLAHRPDPAHYAGDPDGDHTAKVGARFDGG
jgi:hypothetical protein